MLPSRFVADEPLTFEGEFFTVPKSVPSTPESMEPTPAMMPSTFQEFLSDPRLGSTAPVSRHMPACEGGPWPEPGTADPVARQQIEFLAAYYHLNRLHDRLASLRGSGGSPETIAALVAALHRAIGYRDLLEDRCAPTGFDAEPEMVGPLTINLVFRHARKQVPENHRRLHPQEACVKVPLPDNELARELAHVPGIPTETILADLRVRRDRPERNEPPARP